MVDAISWSLFKQLFPVLILSLNVTINDLLRERFFSIIVTPVLKSKQIDSDALNNYRLVSNLITLSKVFEQCMFKHLSDHLQRNGLYESYQSSYRPFRNGETALMNIYGDVLEDWTTESHVIKTLLDFFIAFDTVVHSNLIRRLKSRYGVEEVVLNWFKSY